MVSVLMSTYNEKFEEIEAAVRSILNQSFRDLELIIINDAPQNKELYCFLLKLACSDERIRVFNNETNIGLAMSMNKAADLAQGEYLARMDADDISYPERLEKEYNLMVSGNYDLVCSGYDVIDENSKIVRENCGFCPDLSMRSFIPNLPIHHPTVMMTRASFEKAGKYRNFICAQDQDLWLRMWNNDAKMQIINEPLLHYRVRENSMSTQKRYMQKCTIDYEIALFWERIKTGDDSYSYKEYLEYLQKHNVYDQKVHEDFVEQSKTLFRAKRLMNSGHKLKGILLRLKVFLTCENYRKSYIGKFKTKWLLYRSGRLGQ